VSKDYKLIRKLVTLHQPFVLRGFFYMKHLSLLCVALILALFFLASCSALRSGTAVKASYKTENDRPETASPVKTDRDGWAARHIPGWKTVAGLVPPPSEARMEWDKRMKRKGNPWSDGPSSD